MDLLVCVLLTAAIISAKSEPLEKPVSLLTLKEDLQSLKTAFPSGFGPDGGAIQYDDKLKIIVRPQTSKAGRDTIIFVDGLLTLAKLHQPLKGDHIWHSPLQIEGLYFQDGSFYYEDKAPVVVLGSYDPNDYFLVEYEPPKGKNHLKTVIEYMSKPQFESELKNAIPKLIYESELTGGRVTKSYFYTTNGVKVRSECDKDTKIVVFNADFYIVVTDKMGIYKKTARFVTMRYDLMKGSFPDLEILGGVFGVSIAPPPAPPSAKRKFNSLKITRQQLMKDVFESKPSREMSSLGVVGMIKYDKGRMFALSYVETNQREVLRITGRFVTQDGTAFCCICLATSKERFGDESGIPVLPGNAVLFSCSAGVTEAPQILLQEETDYIEMEAGYTIVFGESKKVTRSDSIKPVRIEPYLEYVSFDQFDETLKIVADIMKIKCANGYHQKSYRLFFNVFLVYDCHTGIASFDSLDLWLSPGGHESLLLEGVKGVTYDSRSERFGPGIELLSDFKLRQLHSKFPAKIPPEMMYMYDRFYGGVDLMLNFESVEWDLYNIRKSLFKSVVPYSFGVVTVDDEVMLRADKLQDVRNGESRYMVMIEGVFETCTNKQCKGEHTIMYDGSQLILRNDHGSGSGILPSKVSFPHNTKLPLLECVTAYKERYVSLNNFRTDMEELTVLLENRCDEWRGTRQYDEKLTLFVYYFANKEPITGYYDCTMKYIFFFNDFKVIKYPNVHGKSSSYRPGEELKFKAGGSTGGSSLELIDRPKASFDEEEEQLRKKFSEYILRDLMYDQNGKSFHSRSLFLAEVYALRMLPSYVKEKSERQGGFKIRLKGGAKVFVFGQNAPKTAWL